MSNSTKHNPPQFTKDLRAAAKVVVYAARTRTWLAVTKRDVKKEAELAETKYSMTDALYVNRQLTMVIS